MPRPAPDATKIDRAAELYLAGQTFKEAAAEVGLPSESVRLFLKRRGIEARSRKERPGNGRIEPPEEIGTAYLAGESEKAIADRLGVSRTVVERWLREAGTPRRSMSEAFRLHQASLTPKQRRINAAAAHAAVRGRRQTEEFRCRVALGKEHVSYGGPPSPGVEAFCRDLDGLGVLYRREKAVGRYNVDIALCAYPVAVEILGGYWHGAKPIHTERTPYILDRGWHLVFVWSTKRIKVTRAAVDETIRLAEEARLHPPTVGQYWVLRGDGQLAAVGQADDDEFPLVPPSERGFKPRTAYGRRS